MMINSFKPENQNHEENKYRQSSPKADDQIKDQIKPNLKE